MKRILFLLLAASGTANAGTGNLLPGEKALAEKEAVFKVVTIKPSVIPCEDKQMRPTGIKWTSSACILDLSTKEDDHIYSVTSLSAGCGFEPGDEVKAKILGSSCTARFQFKCDSKGKPLNPPDKDPHQMSCDNRTSWFLRGEDDLSILKQVNHPKK